MNKRIALTVLAILLPSPLLAQEHGAAGGQQMMLPPACEAAATAAGTMPPMGGMQNMAASMDDVQKANMDAMMQMHDPMMKAMMIKDADLAFNCGMIAHHRGAIAMAQVELQMGADEASKKMAQMIIDAQEKEIAEMTAWVEKHAKQ